MFQTEPIRFLQSFSTEWLDRFFWLISEMGYASFYIPVLLLITFGFSLRRGFLLIQMLLWVGIVTNLLKEWFGLPRPFHVDSAVRLIGAGIDNPTPHTGMGGRWFWGLPRIEAIEYARSLPDVSFGMPSGHTSGTVTFWGGLSLIYRLPALKVAAALMFVLMPLSRMYLGVHFVGDVIGGFLLGLLFLVAAHRWFIRDEARHRLLQLVRLPTPRGARAILFIVALLAVPFVLPVLSPTFETENAGRLLGLNVAFLALAWRGLPQDRASIPRRVARIAIAFALFGASGWLTSLALDPMVDRFSWVQLPASAVPVFVAFWGGVTLSGRWKLYGRGHS